MVEPDQLEQMRQAALFSGGETQIEKQYAKGKKTARERLSLLLDADFSAKLTCS